MKSYDRDIIYCVDMKSQAADEGGCDAFFSFELKLRSRWSDYRGGGMYRIDGFGNAVDGYPSKVGGRRVVHSHRSSLRVY